MGHYAYQPRFTARHLVYDSKILAAATSAGWSSRRKKRFSKQRLYFKVDLFFLEGKFMVEWINEIQGEAPLRHAMKGGHLSGNTKPRRDVVYSVR